MNALLEARPSTAAAKSRLSVLTTFDSTDSNSALHTHTLTSSTPAGNGTPAGGLDAGSGGTQLARPGPPGTPSRSSYAIVASELLAASSPHTPARTEEGDAGSPLGLQPHRVHARQPPRKGTSSFQAVSREQLQRQQRPASAGAAGGPGGAAADYFREGYDSLTRPRSSRGPVAVFDKQLPRPASAAMLECSSPAALGPGAYHRSGQLPASYTGADVPAGHVISSGGVLQPGTELAYEPNPEVLGHMHKTPAWSMPPNRTATSKKWAQAAMKAGLQ
ncbi:hypothetical protein OEZ86_011431 [Tetradesmus obliquus]|nr:hypothetical protein OEZ86_011431 [Tetradesmus obliquus]